MNEILLIPEWIGIYGLVISIILASITYIIQKKIDRRYQIQSLRRGLYVGYFAALFDKFHNQTIKIKDDKELERTFSIRHLDALGEMRRYYFQILVTSSDEVCRKAAKFQAIVGEDANSRSNEAFSDAYGNLLQAIRNEGFGKSSLTPIDIEKIVTSKI